MYGAQDPGNWQSFTQQGINITSGQPNVSVVMAEGDVTFFLDFPLTITDLTTGAVTDLNEFISVYPVRMKKIQEFAKLLMEEEVININYDIRASDGIIMSYKTDDIFEMQTHQLKDNSQINLLLHGYCHDKIHEKRCV